VLALFVVFPGLAQDADSPHGEYVEDCALCHGGKTWLPVVVSGEFRGKTHPFPLRRSHDLPDCRACHRSLDFTKADPACVSCHQDVHRGELGIDCARCHVPRTFVDRTRMQENHFATRFPLRGTHRALDCEDCHPLRAEGALQWVNTPTECVACHRAAYQSAKSPDHVAASFPTECDLCHPVTVWSAARFNHALTTAPCATCHLADYNATTDPSHRGAGFPTTCETCHTAGGRWSDVRFDHDGPYFPIYSGRHRGQWDSCSACHLNSQDYSQFSCVDCHEHSDRAAVEHDHDEVSGFTYNSAACYACHPRGEKP
jgi:hypothetical protein